MPNKTVLFHISKNGGVCTENQPSGIFTRKASHARSEVINATEGHITSTKGQGTEIYMHKAAKWNRMHVHVQRTSLAE